VSEDSLESMICTEDLVNTCRSILRYIDRSGFKIAMSAQNRFVEVGRGFSSRVFLAYRTDGSIAALKIRKAMSKRDTLAIEGYILKLLMGSEIAPRVYSYGDDYILMEYISGISIGKALELYRRGIIGELYIRRAITSTLKALYKLDTLGIDHLEIGDPRKHMILQHGIPNMVRIIDFESATLKPNPNNIPRFFGGFIMRRARWILSDAIKEALELVKTYKRLHGIKNQIVLRLIAILESKEPKAVI
jgi:putative serine/threonine protein kinase